MAGLIEAARRPTYSVSPMAADQVIHSDGAPFMIPLPEMFDYDLRIKNMDRARVDIAVVSLTCPMFIGATRRLV